MIVKDLPGGAVICGDGIDVRIYLDEDMDPYGMRICHGEVICGVRFLAWLRTLKSIDAMTPANWRMWEAREIVDLLWRD